MAAVIVGLRALCGNAQGWKAALQLGERQNVLRSCSTFAGLSRHRVHCPPEAMPAVMNVYVKPCGHDKCLIHTFSRPRSFLLGTGGVTPLFSTPSQSKKVSNDGTSEIFRSTAYTTTRERLLSQQVQHLVREMGSRLWLGLVNIVCYAK